VLKVDTSSQSARPKALRPSMKSRRVVSFVLALLLTVSSAFAAGERKTFDPLKFSTGAFHGCPVSGEGSDPYLNSLKNRDKSPKTARLYTVNRLYEKSPTLPKKKIHRSKWTPHQQDLAARWERQAVMVEGYLVFDAVKEGQEACNCGSTKYVDHHFWLASTPSASRAKAMVVEVSPREWPYHQGWNKAETFRRLIRAKERVRVIGWLTWDQEHAAHLGKYRRTLWEVHPIHQIQVRRGNQWVSL
jgi:hypothetical protein